MTEIITAFLRLAEAIKELACRMYETIAAIFRMNDEDCLSLLDNILANVNPRCYYLYKHAKKARVRKKNGNRLIKELCSWVK